MHRFCLLLTAATLSGTAAARESEPPAPVPVAATGAPAVLLPANTEVVVRLNEALSSSTARVGHRFALSVARDVLVGNSVVIPRGTPGTGEVTWRTGRGAFGKSGKMEIAVTALSLNGRTVPVAGKTRLEGRGGTGATIGAVFVGGIVAGAFVTGRSAQFEQGHEWRAFTTETLATGPGAGTIVAVPVPVVVSAPMVVAVARPAPTVVHTAIVAAPVRVAAPVISYFAPVPRVTTRAVVRDYGSRFDVDWSDAYARRLAAAQGVRGYEPKQGWTISD